MARPEQLSPALLLKTVTAEPSKPSALAKALGVSRATVHRKLEALLAEGLVVRVGEGPTAAYRLPSVEESLQRADALRPDGLVRMVLDKRSAWAVRESLELFTRIGIGQLEEVYQTVRMNLIAEDASEDKLHSLESLIQSFKRIVTGMSPHSSFGIYSPKVPAEVTKAWALMRALRHRIAWDQTPEGHMGVWHDEPLFNEDSLAGLSVLSDTPGEDGKPTRYYLELPRDAVAVIGRAVKVALRIHVQDFQVLNDLVEEGIIMHTDLRLLDADKKAASDLVTAMRRLFVEESAASKDVALDSAGERLLRVVKACDAFSNIAEKVYSEFEPEGFVALYPLTDSPIAHSLDSLPEGMLLNFKGGKYRVIAPRGEDELLTIVAESKSLQTVIQMARNLQNGGSARGHGF